MRKILIAFAFVFCFSSFFNLNFASATDANCEFVVTANSATLWSEANFSSQKVDELSHKDIIIVQMTENEPTEYLFENFVFFKANFEDKSGFVLSDLVTKKVENIESVPNFNAKTNTECKVFLKNDTTFVESDIVLEKHCQIFLYEGFDSKSEFTAISYVKDNSVFYGYLKTKNISPNGINPIIITCISLILAIVGIVFALVFMKNKKVKLKQNKSQTNKNQ